MALSPTFQAELDETDELLGDAERRLRALQDFAKYDGLHPEVIRRLGNKANAVEMTRNHLGEIPEMAAGVQR